MNDGSRAVDVLVVGAGFSGATAARILAEAGHRVHVVDRRPHVGGNAWDTRDRWGVRVHPYGPHAFHTDAGRIVDFLSRFTGWTPYEHRVLASVDGMLVPVPVNRTTINRLYGLDLDAAGVTAFLERVRERREPERTSEDVALNRVGRDLCDRLFRGYTRKQWGLGLADLAPLVLRRIPVRTDDDDRYFTDRHQAQPSEGFARMFERMLEHPGISVALGCDYRDCRDAIPHRHLVYTGAIDEYFDRRFGPLPYRSLRFEFEHLDGVDRFQPVGTVNFPNEHAYTRISEFRHFTGEPHRGTTIVREYPEASGDPFYPIPRPENDALYQRYRTLAEARDDVTFVGRLAQYRYYNMDQAVGAAMTAAERVRAALAARR
ncbi:MAG TPA: UDP-galactopyranose mutase [Casimicrobiaceae bacterium]|nr:UDP-galactopyranose mutase [Casimicrobiaceae bacterium]